MMFMNSFFERSTVDWENRIIKFVSSVAYGLILVFVFLVALGEVTIGRSVFNAIAGGLLVGGSILLIDYRREQVMHHQTKMALQSEITYNTTKLEQLQDEPITVQSITKLHLPTNVFKANVSEIPSLRSETVTSIIGFYAEIESFRQYKKGILQKSADKHELSETERIEFERTVEAALQHQANIKIDIDHEERVDSTHRSRSH